MPRSADPEAAFSGDLRRVSYAPSVNLSADLPLGQNFSRAAGAKSMPASRRTSASEYDSEDLAAHVHSMQLNERGDNTSPQNGGARGILRNGNLGEGARFSAYNAGMMLDEQLDQEMHSELSSTHEMSRSKLVR
jgi:hypothetical protein